jgi:preprotein translocase subunit SecG
VLFAQSVITTPGIPWYVHVLNFLVLALSLFLILLVLIQRGKGGGLSGAFGGVGGSSAFGSRAGDMFTKITIGVAAAWIILTMIQVVIIQRSAAPPPPPPVVERGE